ncbi:hypothetical protein FB45DRAFT_1056422 [Roridomyces roridus]|uniref:Uncharacterized protein n=1 Tax=Roridomyces roridus TaxID=1738132 RepID=A0AAD7FRG7_9AGAR|nr:hypothetical protein FB45DRAFT_1056422 [Roridomyces roridus]
MCTHFGQRQVPTMDYDKLVKCGFPRCEKDEPRTLGKALEHLHHQHSYSLLRCNAHCTDDVCDPLACTVDHHNKSCFKLAADFLFHDDARIWSHDTIPQELRRKMPATTLIDFRRGDQAKRWWARIFDDMNGLLPENGKKKKKKDKEIDPSTLRVVPFEPKRLPKKKKAGKTAATQALALATPSPNNWRLRLCLTEIAKDARFKALNAPALADAIDSVTVLVGTKKEDMPACGIEFTGPVFARFLIAVKKWRRQTEIEECVKELVKKGLVTGRLRETLLAEEHVDLQGLLTTSAGDMGEYELVVDEDQWAAIVAHIESYLEQNQ